MIRSRCHRCGKRRVVVNIPNMKLVFAMIWGRFHLRIICPLICKECADIIKKKLTDSLYKDGV